VYVLDILWHAQIFIVCGATVASGSVSKLRHTTDDGTVALLNAEGEVVD
jgi:hypothetical protein